MAAINTAFNTNFKAQCLNSVDPELGKKILDYLTSNCFSGLIGDNWHELAKKYWKEKEK